MGGHGSVKGRVSFKYQFSTNYEKNIHVYPTTVKNDVGFLKVHRSKWFRVSAVSRVWVNGETGTPTLALHDVVSMTGRPVAKRSSQTMRVLISNTHLTCDATLYTFTHTFHLLVQLFRLLNTWLFILLDASLAFPLAHSWLQALTGSSLPLEVIFHIHFESIQCDCLNKFYKSE